MSSFLNLHKTAHQELTSVRLRRIDEDSVPSKIRGRTWCALNLVGHASKLIVKPIVYLIASLVHLILSPFKDNYLKQSGHYFACAIISPFTETVKMFKAAAGIIRPNLYYRHQGIVFNGETPKFAAIGDTYNGNGEGNLDFSYVNSSFGCAFVLDGAGHNKPARKQIQDPIIAEFISDYTSSLGDFHFDKFEEIQKFVQEKINAFGTKFNKDLADFAPALMFAQVVKFGNERYLLTAHMADAALYIKTQNGWETSSPQPDVGFGSNGFARGAINLPEVKFRKVSPGDVLVGFTDGIGEFISKTECIEILNTNQNPSNLLREFQQKIINKGNEHAEKVKRGGQEDGEAANGGKTIKFHDPDPRNPQDHDDISLFYLKVE